jgi:hypothetical protein
MYQEKEKKNIMGVVTMLMLSIGQKINFYFLKSILKKNQNDFQNEQYISKYSIKKSSAKYY